MNTKALSDSSISHHATAPIGIYDSGLGGLSVVKELQRQLPHESFVYVADTAHVPYGGRPAAEIKSFSDQILAFLIAHRVKAVLCACNSSSVLILPEYKVFQNTAVWGLAQAGSLTAQGYQRVAVLATEATVKTGLYKHMMRLQNPELDILSLACPEFVPLVEKGQWHGPEVEAILGQRLRPLHRWQPEAVVLGCSHYPFLAQSLKQVLPTGVELLDPAAQIVRQLKQGLSDKRLLNSHRQEPRWYTTGAPEAFRSLAEAYLGQPLLRLSQTQLQVLPPTASMP